MGKQSKKYNKESSKYDKKKKKGDKKDDKKGQIPIEKLKFATGDNQAENYERLKKDLANKQLKDYGAAIAYMIKNEKEYDFDAKKPEMRLGTIVLPSVPTREKILEKEREDKEITADYEIEMKDHNAQVKLYKSNKQKVCAVIIEKCTANLLVQLEAIEGYQEFSLFDPVRLLKEIKNLCLTHKGVKNPMMTFHNAVYGLATVKQVEKESVKDFTEKVKNRTNAMVNALTSLMVANDENYLDHDRAKRKEVEDDVLEEYMSYITIEKADHKSYKDIKQTMRQQYTLGNKPYPKKLSKAMEVLHQNYKRPSNNSSDNKKKKKEDDKEEEVRSFAQSARSKPGFRCFKCGRSNCPGKDECPYKDKPPSEWAANRAMAHADRSFSQRETTAADDDESTESNQSSGTNVSAITTNTNRSLPDWIMDSNFFQVFQFAEVSGEDFRWYILLDNQSGRSLFCNSAYINNIVRSGKPLHVKTNADTLVVNQKANLPWFGKLWYSKDAITNILSFAEVKDHKDFKVKYN